MSDFIFLFDSDSTMTKQEILPTISQKIGRQKEMRELTEATWRPKKGKGNSEGILSMY